MSTEIDVSWDNFFYYGKQDVETENQFDIWCGLLSGGRVFFYNRRDSAGVKDNLPTGIFMYLQTRYNIINWIAYRNSYVSSGDQGKKDRRIAASQDTIGVDYVNQNLGEINIDFKYISFSNYKQPTQSLSVPISVGG